MYADINRIATAAFDTWLAPFRALPPAAQVCITALPVALFALLVFRFASSQSGIRAARDRIKAYLLELWLYRDEPAVLLRAQAQVILSSLEYLGYSLPPLAIMIVPLALVMAQVESHFGWRAPEPGESVIVTATLDAAAAPDATPAALTAGVGLTVETPPLRLEDTGQVLWRVRAEAPGEYRLEVRAGAASAARALVVGPGARALAPASYRDGDWRLLASPAEPPLAAGSALASVEVGYARRGGEFLGLSGASWLLLGVSMLLGYALRGLFGVVF